MVSTMSSLIGRIFRSRSNLCIFLLLLAAIGIRWYAADRFLGYQADQYAFVQWMQGVRQYGLSGAYLHDTNLNYPPVFLLLLGIYGSIAEWFGIIPQAGELSFKFLLLLIDGFAIVAAVFATARMKSVGWRLALLALIALNPALLMDSAVWGQVDMLHGMLMIGAVLQIAKRPWLSGLLMGIALLTKFQSIALLPILAVYLLYLVWQQRVWKAPILWLTGFCAPWLATLVYFGASGSLGTMFSQAYTDTVGQFKSVTMNAMNIWFHLAGVSPSTADTETIAAGITLRTFSLFLFGVATLFICYCVIRSLKQSLPVDCILLKAGAAMNFSFFMLPTEIHERYSVPALLFVLFAVMKDKRWIAAACTLSVTVFLNLHAALEQLGGESFGRAIGRGPGGGGRGMGGGFVQEAAMSSSYVWVSILHVILLIAMLAVLYLDTRSGSRIRRSPPVRPTYSGIEASPS